MQENRLFRADFLAEAAEDAAQHVDLEFRGIFSTLPVGLSGRVPGGVMRMALGGQTNSQSWQETHLVLPS
jgi:hypothetical protein